MVYNETKRVCNILNYTVTGNILMGGVRNKYLIQYLFFNEQKFTLTALLETI